MNFEMIIILIVVEVFALTQLQLSQFLEPYLGQLALSLLVAPKQQSHHNRNRQNNCSYCANWHPPLRNQRGKIRVLVTVDFFAESEDIYCTILGSPLA
jgi:hypothetical protein